MLGLNTIVPAARLALAKLLIAKGDMAGAKEQLDVLQKQFANAGADFPLANDTRTLATKIR